MLSKIKLAFPIVLLLVLLVFLWIKFETVKKDESEQITAEPVKEMVELIHYVDSFELTSKIPCTPSKEVKFNGESSAFMAKDNLYGPTYIFDSLPILKESDEAEVSFMIFTKKPIANLKLNFSVGDKAENLIFASLPIDEVREVATWVERKMTFPIDKKLFVNRSQLELRTYVMNEVGAEFYIDNLTVKIKSLR